MRVLTALKQAGNAPQSADGRPPEMPLAKIIKDPDNPRLPLHLRTPDEQQQQRELNANVRERGVKSPISLRPHPSEVGTWIINCGHCRFDAAEAAGFTTIPYFIDPNFDSYDQISENLHRSDLSIWAIAGFIKRKLDEGQLKTEIAQRLGKEGLNYVTEHVALVDAPSCVHQAYANAVRSPRTLYDLRRAHDEFPDQVDAWCNSGARITREAIKDLLEGLRRQAAPSSPQEPAVVEERTAGQMVSKEPVEGGDGLRHDVTRQYSAPSSSDDPAPAHKTTGADGSMKKPDAPEATIDQGIRVRYQGRPAMLKRDCKVKIAIDGEETVLNVRIADLEFVEAG